MPNALSAPNAYMGAPKKPQNEMLGAAVRGFQRGFDPAGFEKQREDAKTAGQDKAKKTLALMQQQRQIPEAQRTQWWQQNAQTIGGIIGQDITQQQVDPSQFTDQALDGHIAALSGELGISPATPEPMSAYQAEQIRLEEEKLKQPKPSDYEYKDTVGPEGPGTYAVNKNNPKDMIFVGEIIPKDKLETGFTLGKDQIRYDADGNEIARGVGGGSGSGGPGAPLDPEHIRLEREYAKSWDGVRNNYAEVDGQYQRLVALGNLAETDEASRSAADLGLIVSFTKMLDPGSVAREGEVKLTQSAASLLDMVRNLPNQWKNGQTVLPPETRAALLKAAAEMHPVYTRAYDKLRRSYFDTAKSYQFEPSRVLMGTELADLRGQDLTPDQQQALRNFAQFTTAGTPTGAAAFGTRPTQPQGQTQPKAPTRTPQVAPEAINELRADPSPEAMAEFDEVFGQGAAQQVLNGSR